MNDRHFTDMPQIYEKGKICFCSCKVSSLHGRTVVFVRTTGKFAGLVEVARVGYHGAGKVNLLTDGPSILLKILL